MLRSENTTIDNREIFATQLPFTKAATLKFKLAKTIGPALMELASAPTVETKTSEVKVKTKEQEALEAKRNEVISNSLCKLFDACDREELTNLIKSMLSGVSVDGKNLGDANFDSTFGPDDITTVYKIVFFVIKLNFGNISKFLGGDKLGKFAKDLSI